MGFVLIISDWLLHADFLTTNRLFVATANSTTSTDCIGASNLKHFILFLVYTWLACVWALGHFGWNYFLCNDAACEFTGLEIHLVRVMTVLSCATLLFVTTILANVTYSFMTGEGTVDRLQRRHRQQQQQQMDSMVSASVISTASSTVPMLWSDVFGTAAVVWWWLPFDPVFDSHEAVSRIYGFAVQRDAVWKEAVDDAAPQPSLLTSSPSSVIHHGNQRRYHPDNDNHHFFRDYSSAGASSWDI
jgi:hypothetical protein